MKAAKQMHGPNQVETEHQDTIDRRTRIGLRLLAVYGSAYGVYIALCAFGSQMLARWEFIGVPVAIWYGFTLMIGAMLMALLYGRLCRTIPTDSGIDR